MILDHSWLTVAKGLAAIKLCSLAFLFPVLSRISKYCYYFMSAVLKHQDPSRSVTAENTPTPLQQAPCVLFSFPPSLCKLVSPNVSPSRELGVPSSSRPECVRPLTLLTAPLHWFSPNLPPNLISFKPLLKSNDPVIYITNTKRFCSTP